MRILVIFVIAASLLSLPIFVRMAKVTLEVVDEQGMPVKNALLGYTNSSPRTDEYGKLSVLKNTSDGQFGGGIGKDGFYDSIFHYNFVVKNYIFWKPWNKHLKVVIRPIVNPVPMYVRSRSFLIPEISKSLGFDLSAADWVKPYGKGINSDFIFRVDRQYKNIDNFDATLTLTFPNPSDGIQIIKDNRGGDYSIGSQFRLPRNAPDVGYQNKLVKRVSAGSYGFRRDESDDNNYIFRVRSKLVDGKLERAMYGKIRGDIRFGPAGENAGLEMFYYLNPDYTRNLEFDPKRNLFTNLPPTEGVALP